MGRGGARVIMTIAGISILVGFFMPWVDFGGIEDASGFTLLRKVDLPTSWLAVLLAVPAGGLFLAAAGLSGVRFSRYLALLVGALIMGYGAYRAFQVFFSVTGPGIWLIAVGALIALIVGLLPDRAAGGVVVTPSATSASARSRGKPELPGKSASVPPASPRAAKPKAGEETRELTPPLD